MRPCFAFKSTDQADTLAIYDELGPWGVQAADFRAGMAAVKSKVLNVEINSPGGDVFTGLAIYNMLRASGKQINVKVMGVAASAASLIVMAGDSRAMPKNSFMMVHNPWTISMGNSDALRADADMLDKIGASILGTYVSRSGKSEELIAPLLKMDTWLTADEALAHGFATEVIEDVTVKASFDMKRADLPENVLAVFAQATEQPEDDEPPEPETDEPPVDPEVATAIEQATVKAGVPEYAGIFMLACDTLAAAQVRIQGAKNINVLCSTLQMKDRAPAFVKAGLGYTEVRAALAKEMAENDTHIVATPPTAKATAGAQISPTSLWASHANSSTRK